MTDEPNDVLSHFLELFKLRRCKDTQDTLVRAWKYKSLSYDRLVSVIVGGPVTAELNDRYQYLCYYDRGPFIFTLVIFLFFGLLTVNCLV